MKLQFFLSLRPISNNLFGINVNDGLFGALTRQMFA